MSVPSLEHIALHSINEQQAGNDESWIDVLDARVKKRKLDETSIEEEIESLKQSLDAKKKVLATIKREVKALTIAKEAVGVSEGLSE